MEDIQEGKFRELMGIRNRLIIKLLSQTAEQLIFTT